MIETGWTAGIPKRAGWYFMRDEGATEPIIDGLVVWVGHNASGVRHEGQFFYVDHKWLQRREFLGPISVSDAEQLVELRRVSKTVLDMLEKTYKERHLVPPYFSNALADLRDALAGVNRAAVVQCADCFAWFDKKVSHTCRQQVRRNQRRAK